MTMLQLEQVCVDCYGKRLLDSIDLELHSGEILAVLGPNGAGKTSLLNTASGELKPSAGSCTFQGKQPSDWPIHKLATQMAVLPQFALLSFPFSVEEVVLLGRTPHNTGRQRDFEIARDCLDMLDARSLATRLYTELSGGERQRVQLARVFSQIWSDPEEDDQYARRPETGRCLLLDEPTAALDLSLRAVVLNALRQFADQGLAIMLVLHDFNLAAQHADRLLLMKDGKVAAQGSADHVLTSSNIGAVFEVNAHILRHPDTACPVVVQALHN